jgi:hypothetical protein
LAGGEAVVDGRDLATGVEDDCAGNRQDSENVRQVRLACSVDANNPKVARAKPLLNLMYRGRLRRLARRA